MGYGTARLKPVPAGLPRLFRRSRSRAAPHPDATGRFPADSLLFAGRRGARRPVVWVERSETHRACRGSGRGRAYGERALEGEFVAAPGALRHAQEQLVERDAPPDQALL